MRLALATIALLFALSAPVLAQTALSLNKSSVGNGTGVWTTLPACSGPANALTFNSANQTFGCNTIPISGPGGSEGAIQYSHAGTFGGLSGTGLVMVHETDAPTLIAPPASCAPNEFPFYAAAGMTRACDSRLTDDGSTLGYTGTVAAGSDLSTGQHLVVAGGTPSITAGPGAGASPTATLAAGSTDSAGWIDVTTGTSPIASATIVTVTAAKAIKSGNLWNCGIAPANANAASAAGHPTAVLPYVPMPAVSASSFAVVANTAQLDASTEYIWRYWCLELP